MTDLPSFLFETGKIGEKRGYFFIGLTGEEEFVLLDFQDKLTNNRCPLDGAYIIEYNEDSSITPKCPACNKYGLSNTFFSEKDIKGKMIPYTKLRIGSLKEELNHLELILKLSENPNNEIKTANLENSTYNQANLSAKTPEPIIVDKSNASKQYHVRETQFTKNSRLNHQANLSERQDNGARIVSMQDYQNQEENKLIDIIVKLADHLPVTDKSQDDEEKDGA